MQDRCRREDAKRSKPAARDNRAGLGGAQPILAAFLLASLVGGASSALAAEAPKPSRPSLPSGEIELQEKKMWEMVNQDRLEPDTQAETGGQAIALQWDDRLAKVAREHSLDMATQGYFNHVSPDGSRPDVRVTGAGIGWQGMGENIAEYGDVTRAEAAFMNEPRFEHNHRHNILNPKFTHVGVGIVRGADGMFYITQEFAREP
jgi:uncharacterized protein YkwD